MTQEQLNRAKKLRELTDIYLRIFERFEEAKGDKDISEFLEKLTSSTKRCDKKLQIVQKREQAGFSQF